MSLVPNLSVVLRIHILTHETCMCLRLGVSGEIYGEIVNRDRERGERHAWREHTRAKRISISHPHTLTHMRDTCWRYSLLEPLARLEQAPCGHAAGELALAAVDQLLQQTPPRAVLLVEHLHRAGPRRLLGAVPASRARRHGLRRAGSSEAATSARACPRLPPSGPIRAARPPRPCSPPRLSTTALHHSPALHHGPAPRPCTMAQLST